LRLQGWTSQQNQSSIFNDLSPVEQQYAQTVSHISILSFPEGLIQYRLSNIIKQEHHQVLVMAIN
jgi:hypothetical protein